MDWDTETGVDQFSDPYACLALVAGSIYTSRSLYGWTCFIIQVNIKQLAKS